MRNYLLTAIAAISLGACVTRTAPGPTLSFSEVRSTILANKARIFIDPNSISNASISAPEATPRAPTSVCLEVNGANRMGGLTGLTHVGVYIYPNGSIESDTIQEFDTSCRGKTFYPFPELNSVRR